MKDSKSAEGNLVGVRPPLPAPNIVKDFIGKTASPGEVAIAFDGCLGGCRYYRMCLTRNDLVSRD